MRHLNGESRHQSSLLPDTLDDYVGEDHPVRVIDAFMDNLNIVDLGFSKASTKTTGRKPYNPADLLKLYVYGYLNQLRSSRRLEKECHRNLEVLWLMKRLAPDFKTIADFRKDNASAIKGACQAFIQFCREADLLTGRLIAIDGSKFKAAASKDKALTRKQLRERRKRMERLVDQYLSQLDKADSENVNVEMESGRVQRALKRLEIEGIQLDDVESAMEQRQSNQHCRTEPDAKLMRSGREGIVLGYNVQTAVDADSGLIVHHDVTDRSADTQELQPMAEETKKVLSAENLAVVADAGYSNGEQQAACEAQDIHVAVPSRRAVNNQSPEFFQKADFKYNADRDCFTCPAGEELHYKTHSSKDKMYLYARTGCGSCALQSRCTKADRRWVSRHFYEEAFAVSEARLRANPRLMVTRMAAVERPFATLKQVMGLRRFLCWGMKGAKAEMGLGILSYNLTRMINEVGVPRLLVALR
ncbi:MAG: IS1182 family transposase [Halioglobus sp.]